MNRTARALYISILCIFLFTANCLAEEGHHDHGGHEGHAEEHHEEELKGPHGGKLFSSGEFSLEVTIFETDVEPQFRLFAYQNSKPLTPENFTATITLNRFGKESQQFTFTPESDYLTSTRIVEEPHSFSVKLVATHSGKEYSWEYDSFEGRTVLSDRALAVAQIATELAGPQKLQSVTRVYGRLLPDEERVAHVSARFPGVVIQIAKRLGDEVAKGDLLAVVESNQSLQPYEIRSQTNGTVLKRHATLGEFVSETKELFVIADLRQVWADFQVYRDDFGPALEGQMVEIDLGNSLPKVQAKISYVSPVTDPATQSKLVRAIVPNTNGQLRPGLFISGTLTGNESPVAIAVRREAIQSFRDWDVVFITDGHTFQATPVKLGRTSKDYVEVLEGLSVGERYVTTNSFVIKADIEKSGASHDH